MNSVEQDWGQVYDNSSGIQELMYSIVLNDGWCSNYDDVDLMYMLGYEIFVDNPEYYIQKLKERNE